MKFIILTLSVVLSLCFISNQQSTAKSFVNVDSWVISNYITMHELLNYKYQAQAQELAQKTVNLLVNDYRESGGMIERSDPESGTSTAGGARA